MGPATETCVARRHAPPVLWHALAATLGARTRTAPSTAPWAAGGGGPGPYKRAAPPPDGSNRERLPDRSHGTPEHPTDLPLFHPEFAASEAKAKTSPQLLPDPEFFKLRARSMAVVSQSPFAMTLGHHQKFSVIQTQQQQPQVIVSSAAAHLGGKRPLAPAPERSSVLVAAASNDLRCKRKIQFVPYGQPPQQPASVARRNARERNRVKQVNNGFATLRQHIPPSVAAAFAPQGPTSGRGASKKLSKVETLRLAVEYIRSLKQMIDEHEEGDLGAGVAMLASQEAALAEAEARYYGTSSPEQYQGYTTTMLSCSEASASPTPSHSSEGSFTTASTYTTAIYHQDNFENYDPKSPEDEELLDAIFSWQQNE